MRSPAKIFLIMAIVLVIASTGTQRVDDPSIDGNTSGITPSQYLGGPYPLLDDSGFGTAHTEMIIPSQFFTGMVEYYNDTLLHKSVLMCRDASISWNRFEFAWSVVQPTPTTWDWSGLDAYMNFSDNYGLRILPVLAYGNEWASENGDYFAPIVNMTAWQAYIDAVVSRYKDRPSMSSRWWQIWNEANIEMFFHGDFVTEFLPAMVAAAQQIRATDSTAKILANALATDIADDLQKMVDYIGKDQFNLLFDGVDIHPYSDTVAEIEQKIDAVKKILAPWYDGELWITEIGWPVNPAIQGVSAEYTKAQNIAKTLVLSRSMNVSHTIVHMWCDWGWMNGEPKVQNATYGENWFGIVDLWANPKPSYFTFKTVANLIGYASHFGPATRTGWNIGQHIEIHVFKQANGAWIIPAWSPQDESIPAHLEIPLSNITTIDAYGNTLATLTGVTSIPFSITSDMKIFMINPVQVEEYTAQDFQVSLDFGTTAAIATIIMPLLVIATVGLAIQGFRKKKEILIKNPRD
nr:hypothetical protein [Candidatus Sigynarchaeota archaeon]